VSNHLVYGRRDRGMSTVADIIMFEILFSFTVMTMKTS
jgi:hypothetical protein